VEGENNRGISSHALTVHIGKKKRKRREEERTITSVYGNTRQPAVKRGGKKGKKGGVR